MKNPNTRPLEIESLRLELEALEALVECMQFKLALRLIETDPLPELEIEALAAGLPTIRRQRIRDAALCELALAALTPRRRALTRICRFTRRGI